MKSRFMRRVLVVGVTALAAVPVAGAANRTVQIDGRLVAPAQVSEAQLDAGHPANTRLVQIGGRLVKPSEVSPWQASSGRWADAAGTPADDSSSGLGTSGIVLVAAAGALALAGSALVMRRRVPVSRAT